MNSEMAQDESKGVAARMEAVREGLTSGLRKPITAPCCPFDSVGSR